MSLELMIYLVGLNENLERFLVITTIILGVLMFFSVPVIESYGFKKIYLIIPIMLVLSSALLTIKPSAKTLDKIVAVHIGKEIIDKTPQEVKDELSKLPMNAIKQLNKMLEEE